MSKQGSKKKTALDNSYWQYFLKLEADFYATARYLGCTKRNDATCSIEFAQQIVCINTECEAVLKRICKTIDSKNQAANMGHYKPTLLKKFPKMHSAPVYVNQFLRTVHPFAEWNGSGGRLEWWNAFQDIKYHRNHNFEKANLINTLDALSALLILELYLYESFSPKGSESLEGTVLLWTPGMPRSNGIKGAGVSPELH
jgi:hypothetical protein